MLRIENFLLLLSTVLTYSAVYDRYSPYWNKPERLGNNKIYVSYLVLKKDNLKISEKYPIHQNTDRIFCI